jgi:type III pantothenate kinase
MDIFRPMLVAIDIGNTDTVVGVFDNDRLINHFRIASNHNLTVDECGFFVTGLLNRLNIKSSDITRLILASVVPRLTPVYDKMVHKYFNLEPIIVSSKTRLPVKITYDDPTQVGADRIANAVAGYKMFGGPLIIVDFGTTINFDVITKEGQYLGGAIAPGPETSAMELARRAARLFEVRIEKPDRAIGRSTAESIKSGLYHGTIGQVEKIIESITRELGTKPKVIATGGLATEFQDRIKIIESIHPTLTLDGLKIIADFQHS